MTTENKCCEKCLNSKFALKGKIKEKFGGICGLCCECHKRCLMCNKKLNNVYITDHLEKFCSYDCAEKKYPTTPTQKWEKEKYGVWIIISEMLDNPDNGIYHTTKCYREIDELIDQFLTSQRQELKEEILGEIEKYVNLVSEGMKEDIKNILKDK